MGKIGRGLPPADILCLPLNVDVAAFEDERLPNGKLAMPAGKVIRHSSLDLRIRHMARPF
jgi:hypothetical protein